VSKKNEKKFLAPLCLLTDAVARKRT